VGSVGGTRQCADDQARFRSLSARASSECARRGHDITYISQLSLGTRSPMAKPTPAPEPADLTRKSVSLVKEYLDIEDLNEALLCVQELNSPRFRPEFVRLAITTAMDMREKECSLVLKLLAHLQSEMVISSLDLKEGVLRVLKGLVDIAIDSPLAPKLLGGLLAGLVLSGAVKLTLVQVSLWNLEDEFLQQDVLNAMVAKWKLQENQVQLVDVCRKASVDKEALLSVAVASDLVKVMEFGAGRAAATPELTLHNNFDMRSNKDEFNLRSLLQRVQMYGK